MVPSSLPPVMLALKNPAPMAGVFSLCETSLSNGAGSGGLILQSFSLANSCRRWNFALRPMLRLQLRRVSYVARSRS